jgi:hypothetical protein
VLLLLQFGAGPAKAEYVASAIAVQGDIGPGGLVIRSFEDVVVEDPAGGVWAMVLVSADPNGVRTQSLIRFHEAGDEQVLFNPTENERIRAGGASMQGRALIVSVLPGEPFEIARTDGSGLEVMVRDGDPAPAPFSGTWSLRADGCVDDSGAVYFAGRIEDGGANPKGLFRRASPTGPVELLVETGDPVPATGLKLDFTHSLFAFECDVTESGAMVFLTGIESSSDPGVFWRSADGATLALIALDGDPRPDGGPLAFQRLDYVEANDAAFVFGSQAFWPNSFVVTGRYSGGLPCCLRNVGPYGLAGTRCRTWRRCRVRGWSSRWS